MKTLRIFIADDHEVVRAGTRALIEHEPDWEICGFASNGQEAIASAKELKPDIVIFDLTMPEMSGLEALRQIKAASPETEVLIFSADASEEIVAHAFDAGAKSYIRKADAGRHLVAAIRSLARHKAYVAPEMSDIPFREIVSCDRGKKQASANGKLSAREREILRLLAEGGSNKETATLLGISVRTAETHRAGLMRKLGLGSVAALVRYAIRNHVIEA